MSDIIFDKIFLKDLVEGNCKGVVKDDNLLFNRISFLFAKEKLLVKFYDDRKLLASLSETICNFNEDYEITFILKEGKMEIKIV